jgi:hypothetical protein
MWLPGKPCVFTFLQKGSLERKGLGCTEVEESGGSSVPLGWAEGEGRKSFQEKLWGNS